MSLPFHYIDLRTFSYATEAEERVLGALETLLPEEAEIERAESEGHHGDPIVVLSTRVERAGEMEYVLEKLRGSVDFETIRSELDDRVDENNALFLQLDKQAAAQGEVALGDGITLRAKIEAYPAKRSKALENVTAVLDQEAENADS